MSSSFTTRSTTHRRPLQSATDPTISAAPLRSAVDQSPNPRLVSKLLAFGFIIFLGCLQFLPATHFRHPSDPFRKWVPFNSNLSSSLTESRASNDKNSGFITSHSQDDGTVHIVSWMDCLDLRMLAVLANSTLSSSRHPELVYFHFFTPEALNDKVTYYKLKVLFPHLNLEIIGQTKVKETMVAYSVGEFAAPAIDEMAPFVIPIVYPSLSKFIYVSPDVIMKGRVEEMLGVNLSNYGVAAAEDCSKKLSASVNIDVLDAIQRSGSKPWVSGTPYAKDACLPELSLILIDASKLGKDLVEAIFWWSKVLNRSERSSPNPAVALALYDKHLKLPNSWRISNLTSPETNSESLVLSYGGGGNVCSLFSGGTISQHLGYIRTQYLPPMSDRILGS